MNIEMSKKSNIFKHTKKRENIWKVEYLYDFKNRLSIRNDIIDNKSSFIKLKSHIKYNIHSITDKRSCNICKGYNFNRIVSNKLKVIFIVLKEMSIKII